MEGLLALVDLTIAAGRDHRPGGGARYSTEREGSCSGFEEGL